MSYIQMDFDSMRRLIVSRLCYSILLLTVDLACYAHSSPYIYTLKEQSYHASKINRSYYIAINTFKNKENANKSYQTLQSSYSSWLKMRYRKGFYHLYLGPIPSKEKAQELIHLLLNNQTHGISHQGVHKPQTSLQKVPHNKINFAPLTLIPKSEPVITPNCYCLKHDEQLPVITLTGGVDWYSHGRMQTFFLQPDVEKTYTSNDASTPLGSLDLFLGLQKYIGAEWYGQYGLTFAGATNATLTGHIWEDASPNFDNYTYQYKMNHAYIGAKGKVLREIKYHFQPYISGSVGVGFNHAYNFSVTPIIYQEVPQSNFAAHTTAALSYTLGLGIQRPINDSWSVGLGYEFNNWGKSRLNRAPEQTLNSGLSLSHFYLNTFLLSLSYMPKEIF